MFYALTFLSMYTLNKKLQTKHLVTLDCGLRDQVKAQFCSMGQELLQFPSLISQIYWLSSHPEQESRVLFICGDCQGAMLTRN